MTTHPIDTPDQKRLVAHCRRCGGFLGEYWEPRGWWHTERMTCTCDPAPDLPTPESQIMKRKLGRAHARARRGDPAPVDVRV